MPRLALRVYNGPVVKIPKVPEDEFMRVIKALVSTPAMPMSEIPRKKEPKQPKPKRAKKTQSP
jgi:hypothetical protein